MRHIGSTTPRRCNMVIFMPATATPALVHPGECWGHPMKVGSQTPQTLSFGVEQAAVDMGVELNMIFLMLHNFGIYSCHVR